MGGDGGCVPQRCDLVRTKGYGFKRGVRGEGTAGGMGITPNVIILQGVETVSIRDVRKVKMSTCMVSHEPLATPVVCDRLGNLYNKEALISALLSKKLPKGVAIKKLSDIKDVADFSKVCPVTSRELTDGNTKSVFFWKCGCLVSRTAISLDKKKDEGLVKFPLQCPKCSAEITEEDGIIYCAAEMPEFEYMKKRLSPKLLKIVEEASVEAKNKKRNAAEDSGGEEEPAAKKPKTNSKKPEVYGKIFHSGEESGQLGSKSRDAFGMIYTGGR